MKQHSTEHLTLRAAACSVINAYAGWDLRPREVAIAQDPSHPDVVAVQVKRRGIAHQFLFDRSEGVASVAEVVFTTWPPRQNAFHRRIPLSEAVKRIDRAAPGAIAIKLPNEGGTTSMTAKTAFTVGQLVRSRVTAQGLVEGDLYRLTSVSVRETPFGGFVTYVVRSATQAAKGETLAITNGHLVLEAADA